MADGDPWTTEEEYVECLRTERSRFAWVMYTFGGMSPAEAAAAAERRYPYERHGTPYRGLIFHDEAWHWAMLELEGESYWLRNPESAEPPEAYHALE